MQRYRTASAKVISQRTQWRTRILFWVKYNDQHLWRILTFKVYTNTWQFCPPLRNETDWSVVVYLYTGLLDIHSLSDQTWQGTHVDFFCKCQCVHEFACNFWLHYNFVLFKSSTFYHLHTSCTKTKEKIVFFNYKCTFR